MRACRGGRMLLAGFLLLAGAVLFAGPPPAAAKNAIGDAATPVEVRSETVRWANDDLDDPGGPGSAGERRSGALLYRGGIVLESDAENFGGLSGLAVTPDGERLLAITDQGFWLSGRLLYDGRDLAGLAEVVMAPMRGEDGAPLAGKRWQDAEALAAGPGGPFAGPVYVAFERGHRVLRYDVGAGGLAALPETIVPPAALRGLSNNGGIEALAVLDPDAPRLIAFTEKTSAGPGLLRAFTLDAGALLPLALKERAPYAPTDAARLNDGSLLLLERRYSPLGGVGAQIRLIESAALSGGPGPLDGTILLEAAGSRHAIDNMEGMAVRETSAGETLVYLVSDDNFNPVQRTLLLQFSLMPGWAGTASKAE